MSDLSTALVISLTEWHQASISSIKLHLNHKKTGLENTAHADMIRDVIQPSHMSRVLHKKTKF